MNIVPRSLVQRLEPENIVQLQNLLLVYSCLTTDVMQGKSLNTAHQLLYLFSGEILLQVQGHQVFAKGGQGILIRKGTPYQYLKKSAPDGTPYHSILFFISDHWVNEMNKPKRAKAVKEINSGATLLLSEHTLLDSFMKSVSAYFNSPLAWDEQMLNLKTKELILNLEHIEPNFFQFFSKSNTNEKPDIIETMELYALHRLTLEEYASITCRSISTFKRDFQKAYSQPPAQWLRKKRLAEAYNRLVNTVSEIGFSLGFEDASNFTKLFKQEFGITPNAIRMRQIIST